MALSSGVGEESTRPRQFVASSLRVVEDVVYIGLGVILAVTAIYLLGAGGRDLVLAVAAGRLSGEVIGLLDQILLILLIVELLYTLQISFREHTLVPEPFLVVALIATVRKILIVTAHIPQLAEGEPQAFRQSLAELGLLALMVPVLVGSLIAMQRHSRGVRGEADPSATQKQPADACRPGEAAPPAR